MNFGSINKRLLKSHLFSQMAFNISKHFSFCYYVTEQEFAHREKRI